VSARTRAVRREARAAHRYERAYQRRGLGPLRSPLVLGLAVLVLGLAAGVAAERTTWLLALAAAALGAGVVAAIVRWPRLGPALFWLAYGLQSTVFFGFSVTGLYYPVYLLMGVNVLVALALGRLEVHTRLLWYVAFLAVVLLGLLPLTAPPDFAGYQRLFIYVMGFLVFFQFPTRTVPGLLMKVQVVTMLVVASWVVVSSIQGGFGYRGNVNVDQNDVSFLIGFGLVPLVAELMARRLKLALAALCWAAIGYGVYAILLLASRGMSIAILVASVAMFGRILFTRRRSITILVAALLAGAVLFSLPGSDSLFVRFNASDVTTANDRIPLWHATLTAFESANVRQIFLGQGFESSMQLIRRVSAILTSTHNAYLEIGYEFGLLGLMAFLGIHLSLLSRFWRDDSPTALYGAGTVIFLLMADLTLTAPDRFLYWVAIGYLLALSVNRDKVEAGEAPPPEGELGPEPEGPLPEPAAARPVPSAGRRRPGAAEGLPAGAERGPSPA